MADLKSVNLVFKNYKGEVIENVEQYIADWVTENPHGSIMVGCDSQAHTKYIKYSVSICLHMKDESGLGHGAHVIFSNYIDSDRNLKTDIYTKLWAEAELSVNAAIKARKGLETVKSEIQSHNEAVMHSAFNEGLEPEDCGGLRDDIDMKVVVHLDFSSDEDRYSNVLYSSGIGFVRGMGFEAYGKPDAWAASHTSDALCKNKQAKGVR